MPDGHGSTRQLTAYTSDPNTNGHVVARYDYDAFGGTINAALYHNTADTLFQYVGEILDSTTGDYRMGARAYRTALGRFLTRDPYTPPIGDTANANLYAYVGNNPVNALDLTGHFISSQVAVTGMQLGMMEEFVLPILYLLGFGTFALWLAHRYSAGTMPAPSTTTPSAQQALQQAVQTAAATGKYTKQQVQAMPQFWVFNSITPQIYQNDLEAMAGRGTRSGASAPDVLKYGGPGTNDLNRPGALAWAASIGIVAPQGQSLDEYPFASTLEGGVTAWLRVKPVDVSEQDRQRTDLRVFYGTQGFKPFQFLVVLVP